VPFSTVILGLDPRTQTSRNDRMKGGSVYILASKRNGTLYIGVTSDLVGRRLAIKALRTTIPSIVPSPGWRLSLGRMAGKVRG